MLELDINEYASQENHYKRALNTHDAFLVF